MWDAEIKKNGYLVETGLPSPKGKQLLSSIKGQLSDGYWENSPRMEQYWKHFCVTEEDGNAFICVSNMWYTSTWDGSKVIQNKLRSMSDAEILKWFAEKIRVICKAESEDFPENGFKMEKGNGVPSLYLSSPDRHLTGGEIWNMRKILLDRAKACI